MTEADGELKPWRVTGGRGAKPSRISGWVGAGGDEPRHNCQLPSLRPVAPARLRRTLVALRRRSRGQHAPGRNGCDGQPARRPECDSVSRPPSCYSTKVPRNRISEAGETPAPVASATAPKRQKARLGMDIILPGRKFASEVSSPHVGIASRGVYECSTGAARTSATHLRAVAPLSLSAWRERRASALLVGALYFPNWRRALFA
jgi:hypothetical protein